jgi:hypothetical protein
VYVLGGLSFSHRLHRFGRSLCHTDSYRFAEPDIFHQKNSIFPEFAVDPSYPRPHDIRSVANMRDRAHIDYDRRKCLQHIVIQEAWKQPTGRGDRKRLVIKKVQLPVLDIYLFDDLFAMKIGHERRELLFEFLEYSLCLAGLESSPFRRYLLPFARVPVRNQIVLQKVLWLQVDLRP